MKLIAAVLGALVAAVALTATSLAASADDDGNANRADQLFGGGRFQFDFDQSEGGVLILPRELSIYATGRNGKNGTGTRWYGNPNAASPVGSAEITCVNVEGTLGVVAGATTPGQLQGMPYVQYFDDDGPPGPGQDMITPVFILAATDLANMPRGFPRVCPSATPPAAWGAVWAPLESGDIALVDGSGGDDD
jgi:hypothetical protein